MNWFYRNNTWKILQPIKDAEETDDEPDLPIKWLRECEPNALENTVFIVSMASVGQA